MAAGKQHGILALSLGGLLVGGLALGYGGGHQLVGLVYCAQGNAAYRVGDYGDAEVHFRKALEKAGGSGPLRYNLGNALFRQGRYAEAAWHYKWALPRLAPDWQAQAGANLGQAYYRVGDLAHSYAAYRRALLQRPHNSRLRQDFLLVARQLVASQKPPAPPPKTPTAPGDAQKEAAKKAAAPEPASNAASQPGAPEQQLSDKDMAELLGLIKEQEDRARGLTNSAGPKASLKARPVASDEKDY